MEFEQIDLKQFIPALARYYPKGNKKPIPSDSYIVTAVMCIARRSLYKERYRKLPYREDMESEATTKMLEVIQSGKVDPHQYPIKYLNRVCTNTFIEMIASEGGQDIIKREMMAIRASVNPVETGAHEEHAKFAELTESSCDYFLKRLNRHSKKRLAQMERVKAKKATETPQN